MDKEEYVLVNKLFASLHVNVLLERMPQFTPLCFTIVLVKAVSALYFANRKQGRLTQYLFWGPKRANVVFKAVKKAIFVMKDADVQFIKLGTLCKFITCNIFKT